MIILNLI